MPSRGTGQTFVLPYRALRVERTHNFTARFLDLSCANSHGVVAAMHRVHIRHHEQIQQTYTIGSINIGKRTICGERQGVGCGGNRNLCRMSRYDHGKLYNAVSVKISICS